MTLTLKNTFSTMEGMVDEILATIASKLELYTDSDQYIICQELAERITDMAAEALNHEYLGEFLKDEDND